MTQRTNPHHHGENFPMSTNTLTAREGYSRAQQSLTQPRPHNATSRAPREGNGARSERQSAGHDAVLKALQFDSRTITVILLSGDAVIGKLVGRDKFTVTVQGPDGIRRVIYKHAIEQFHGEEKVQRDPA
jgi:sRNA-binding regulator protein Hfq